MKRMSIIICFIISVALIGCLLRPVGVSAGCSCEFSVYNVIINGHYAEDPDDPDDPIPKVGVLPWPFSFLNNWNKVTVEFDYVILNPSSCKGCLRQLVIGVDNIPLECIEVGIPKSCWDGDGLKHEYRELYIPYDPIKYRPEFSYIYVKDYAQYKCSDAETEYRRNSSAYCRSVPLAKVYKAW